MIYRFSMYNLYHAIANSEIRCRRFVCRDSLFTIYNCNIKNRYEDIWSHSNYIIYVLEGRKIWHTPHGSFDLRRGDCVFIQKGAAIVEQFFDTEFCLCIFFVPDEFICDVLKGKSKPLQVKNAAFPPVMKVESNKSVEMYFNLMVAYFENSNEPDEKLLELKFRELIMTIADNPANADLRSFFSTLLQAPQTVNLARVMEDNFSFNLTLSEFATMTSRSLSAFKRDFEKHFNTTPGRWLLEKRLKHAMHLITHCGKTVSEAAFESGFEDPSHFSRAFRKQFGISPANVKQQFIA